MKDEKGELIQAGTTLLAWDPQGRRIAVIRRKPAIYIYSKGAGTLLHELAVKNPEAYVESLAWSPDGFKLAAGLSDGTIRVFKTPK